MRLFKNIKYDAIVACASIGAMVYYSMTVIWPTLIGALFTTDVKEIGWLHVLLVVVFSLVKYPLVLEFASYQE